MRLQDSKQQSELKQLIAKIKDLEQAIATSKTNLNNIVSLLDLTEVCILHSLLCSSLFHRHILTNLLQPARPPQDHSWSDPCPPPRFRSPPLKGRSPASQEIPNTGRQEGDCHSLAARQLCPISEPVMQTPAARRARPAGVHPLFFFFPFFLALLFLA